MLKREGDFPHSFPNKRQKNNDKPDDEKFYFEAYADIGIHEDMIRDKSRTDTYRNAILSNPSDFKNKIVLDVGCGTGILSLFAVEAGAKHVYAVDASSIIDEAEKIIERNKMSDKVTLIKGRVEDVEIPEEVDVIISEWMGYFLLYESMLKSITFARDKWLKKDGKMYPSVANLWISLFNDDQYYYERIDFWQEVYGYDFRPIIPFAKKCAFKEPQVEYISPTDEISFGKKILSINICKDDYEKKVKCFKAPYSLESIGSISCHGICAYFSVEFLGTDKSIILSTSPSSLGTHWRQTLFFFDSPLDLTQGNFVNGFFKVSTNRDNDRMLDIEIKYGLNMTDESKMITKTFELK